MSSHHFVKEQQEPAVFILDANGINLEDIGPMLEWVPTILVTERAMEKVLSWGIKVDILLATTEYQESHRQLLEDQYPLKFITCSTDNDLEVGLDYLRRTDHQAGHLVGFPHTDFTDLQPILPFLNLTIVDEGWKYYPIKSSSFSKWFAPSEIRILGEENSPIEIKNSLGEMIFPIHYLTQIEVPEGISELSASDIFWVGEILTQY